MTLKHRLLLLPVFKVESYLIAASDEMLKEFNMLLKCGVHGRYDFLSTSAVSGTVLKASCVL